MTHRPIRRRAPLAAAALLSALFAGPALAGYDEGSTAANITESCKDFTISDAGVLGATCNKSGGTNATTLDLDSYIGVDSYGHLTWSGTNYSDECENEYLSYNSTTDSLYLAIECFKYQHGGRTRVYTDIKLNGKIKNSSGSLAKN